MSTDRKKIIIGSDHAAFQMKELIKSFLSEMGWDVSDQGPENADSVDYPDFGVKVAASVASGEYERGILMCGTGIGISMVANRFPHVRAALCGDRASIVPCAPSQKSRARRRHVGPKTRIRRQRQGRSTATRGRKGHPGPFGGFLPSYLRILLSSGLPGAYPPFSGMTASRLSLNSSLSLSGCTILSFLM